jgi:hypothetical protein
VKPLACLVCLAALAVGAAACGSSSRGAAAAATVNGHTITNQQVVDELRALAANKTYIEQINQGYTSNGQPPATGKAKDTFGVGFTAQVLSRQIAFSLVHGEVAKRHLKVDDACKRAAKDDLVRQIGNAATFDAFSPSYQQQTIANNADVLVLQGDLLDLPCVATSDVTQSYYDKHKDQFVQVCASHILAADQTTAEAISQQLQAGGDFATIAKAQSADQSSAPNGGDLGCFFQGDYPAEFEDAALAAPIGVPTAPVQTSSGYEIIKVTSRDTPPVDQIRDQVTRTVQSAVNDAFSQWLQQATLQAKVTVDKRYGEWDPATGQVTAPSSSSSTSSSTSTTSSK